MRCSPTRDTAFDLVHVKFDVAITYIPMACGLRNDGKRIWRESVLVERLWRSDKHEQAYLHIDGNIAPKKCEQSLNIARIIVFNCLK